MNIRDYVESLSLGDGETHRGNCPQCNGKGTFTSMNDGGTMKYNCYKLGCRVGGIYDTDMTAAEIIMRIRPPPSKASEEAPTMEIPEYVVQPKPEHKKYHNFVGRWGLWSTKLLYDVKDERVVFPIYYKGRIIDANGRAVGKKLPKWYRYTGNADYYMCSYGDTKKTLLLVEDCVSAEIASQEISGMNTMAILGTSLTSAHMKKVSEYDNVIVALDPDAAYKTLQFSRDIALWTNANTVAFRLDDDIKYKLRSDLDRLKEIIQ